MTIAWRARELDEVASTNDEARRAAERGEVEGLVITAKKQTKGRGRHERVWESPEGNLYLSALLTPPDMPRSAGLYSFATALAIADTIKHFLPQAEVQLKWPNDVLSEGKKISGILLEVVEQTLVIGVGINIVHYPKLALYPATSIAEQGASPPISLVRDAFLSNLSRWNDMYKKQGFEPLRAAWLGLAQKGALTVKLPQESFSGAFVNLDERGHLRLRLENGEERAISAGDVFIEG